MNREILLLEEQIKDAYEGEPWFGRNIGELLSEIDEETAFKKPAGQHSIVELVWHMINWKEFAISRLRDDDSRPLEYFEINDWRELDANDPSLWQKGVKELGRIQNELIEVIQQQKDQLLNHFVPGRTYTFRKLLYGILQHDIYHIGQIAYLKKLLEARKLESGISL
jgi:uncharacterized damage-inducible protein DinB